MAWSTGSQLLDKNMSVTRIICSLFIFLLDSRIAFKVPTLSVILPPLSFSLSSSQSSQKRLCNAICKRVRHFCQKQALWWLPNNVVYILIVALWHRNGEASFLCVYVSCFTSFVVRSLTKLRSVSFFEFTTLVRDLSAVLEVPASTLNHSSLSRLSVIFAPWGQTQQ